jgi:hypothetical protein
MNIQLIKSAVISAVSHLRTRTEYKEAKNENKSQLLYSTIAMRLAFQHAEMPSGKDIPVRQFYTAYVVPMVEDVLAAVNEVELIDFNLVKGLVEQLYVARYDILHGEMSDSVLMKFALLSPRLSGDFKEFLQGALDVDK